MTIINGRAGVSKRKKRKRKLQKIKDFVKDSIICLALLEMAIIYWIYQKWKGLKKWEKNEKRKRK